MFKYHVKREGESITTAPKTYSSKWKSAIDEAKSKKAEVTGLCWIQPKEGYFLLVKQVFFFLTDSFWFLLQFFLIC